MYDGFCSESNISGYISSDHCQYMLTFQKHTGIDGLEFDLLGYILRNNANSGCKAHGVINQ